MKIILKILTILALSLIFTGSAVADDTESASIATSGQIAISSVTLDPQVFMNGDAGKVVITVKNTGSSTIQYNRVELYSSDLRILNDEAYDTRGYIGAGNEMQYTFSVKASSPDGVYYPRFYMDISGGNSISYNIPLEVESSGVVVSVTDSPDYYQKGITKTVKLVIGNPRTNDVNGATVTVSGDVTSKQTEQFIGKIAAGSSAATTFDVTPTSEGSMTFTVTYKNGLTTHTSTITLPITYGVDKKNADPILNNVQLSNSGSYQTISADITNAGIDDAKSVVVTVGAPAVAVDPYKSYVIGSLDSDDFSSFELTFTSPISEVPVIITYKDENGNKYEKTVSVSSSTLSGEMQGSDSSSVSSGNTGQKMSNGRMGGMMGFGGMGSGSLPITEIIILIIVIVLIAIAWKKGLIEKAFAIVSGAIKGKKNRGNN